MELKLALLMLTASLLLSSAFAAPTSSDEIQELQAVKRLSSDHRIADLLASQKDWSTGGNHHGLDLEASGRRKRRIDVLP